MNRLPPTGWLSRGLPLARRPVAVWLNSGLVLALMGLEVGMPIAASHWRRSDRSNLMIIGVDPHKSSHTAAALNPAMNSPVASLRVEASLAGVAPIEVASGERTRHRLSRRGDRQLNSAIHLIAVTQVRMHNSVGRKYFDKKIAEGKTRNEAMRCLKRRLANHLWRLMIADERHLAARPQETPIAA